MTTSIDEALDEAVHGLGVVYNGVDGSALSFIPAPGTSIADTSTVLDSIMERLEQHGLFERLPPQITTISLYGL